LLPQVAVLGRMLSTLIHWATVPGDHTSTIQDSRAAAATVATAKDLLLFPLNFLVEVAVAPLVILPQPATDQNQLLILPTLQLVPGKVSQVVVEAVVVLSLVQGDQEAVVVVLEFMAQAALVTAVVEPGASTVAAVDQVEMRAGTETQYQDQVAM